MYERFTDRSRKVMQLANQEAQRFNHEYIGTEHILLGLIAEGSGVAANVLKNLDIGLSDVRREVEKIVQHGPAGEQVVMGRLPHTPRAKKVIEYTIEEARHLKANYVGTEHLLLGLIREEEGIAAQVLRNCGLKLDDVRSEVRNLLGHPGDSPEPDVVFIPKHLRPQSDEAYSISVSAAPPPVTVTDEHLKLVRERVRHLTEQREAFVAALDFVLAAKCRDEAEALKCLLAWYEATR